MQCMYIVPIYHESSLLIKQCIYLMNYSFAAGQSVALSTLLLWMASSPYLLAGPFKNNSILASNHNEWVERFCITYNIQGIHHNKCMSTKLHYFLFFDDLMENLFSIWHLWMTLYLVDHVSVILHPFILSLVDRLFWNIRPQYSLVA